MKTHLVMMGLAGAAATALIAIIACGAAAKPADATPANNNASTAQCGRDSDCKGDRICDHGQCVSPR